MIKRCILIGSILIFGAVFFTGCEKEKEVVSSVEEKSVDQRIIDMVQQATDDPVLQWRMEKEVQFLIDNNHVNSVIDIKIEFDHMHDEFIYTYHEDIFRPSSMVKDDMISSGLIKKYVRPIHATIEALVNEVTYDPYTRKTMKEEIQFLVNHHVIKMDDVRILFDEKTSEYYYTYKNPLNYTKKPGNRGLNITRKWANKQIDEFENKLLRAKEKGDGQVNKDIRKFVNQHIKDTESRKILQDEVTYIVYLMNISVELLKYSSETNEYIIDGDIVLSREELQAIMTVYGYWSYSIE